MFNDYANPVAASELPFQKPVIGNSGSAFCSVAFFVHEANATEAPYSQENEERLRANELPSVSQYVIGHFRSRTRCSLYAMYASVVPGKSE